MTANAITLARFPVLLVGLVLFYLSHPPLVLAGVGLVFLGVMLDTVDGIVARRTGQTSLLGSALDIAADRSYELALWVWLADLDLVPVAIPLIVVARTSLTDALRAIGLCQGVAPFEQQRSALARFLVASPWMRTAYSAAKVTTFCGLGVALALAGMPAGSALRAAAGPMTSALQVAAWVTVGLCLARGVPVIVSGLRRHWTGAPADRLTPGTPAPSASAPVGATLPAGRPAARPA